MRRFLKFAFVAIVFVFIFILVSSAIGATIDKTLFLGNKNGLLSRYRNLLIDLNTADNSEYNTQKTILHALINILNSKVSLEFDFPNVNVKNQQDFLVLLQNVAKFRFYFYKTMKKIDDINKKLYSLGRTIKSMSDNESDLMTYQLQYAFYKISLDKLKHKLDLFRKDFPLWENRLYRAFLNVSFNKLSAKREIENKMKEYDRLDDQSEKLVIDKDRLVLLSKNSRLSIIVRELNRIEKLKDKIAFDIVNNYMLMYLYSLKHSGDLSDLEDMIERWISAIEDAEYARIAKNEKDLLFYIAKRKMGIVRTIIKDFENNGYQVVYSIFHFIKKPIFSLGGAKISVLSLFLAVFIFIIGLYFGNEYKKRIKDSRFSKNITLSTRTILGNIGYYTIVLITFFISLKIIGVNLSSLTVILGALSVGIGFGLQNMVSNFISGIILMLENSIRIGDYIEISNDLKGVVKDIQMRSTTIITNDHIEVIVPNQTLFQNNVINWTLTEKVRRFKIPFSVAYGVDVDRVRSVIFNALEKSNLEYVKNDPNKRPEIKMVSMGSSSVDFSLDIWVSGDDVIYPRRTISNFLIMIYNALNENGITIPFPQLDLHVKDAIVIKKE